MIGLVRFFQAVAFVHAEMIFLWEIAHEDIPWYKAAFELWSRMFCFFSITLDVGWPK